jgi:putative ABC transport system permease protein
MLRQVPAGRVVLAAAVTLYGLVGLVLLVACANVAGLMLVRAGEHRHEMGRRIALGATPRAIAALILRDGIRVIAGGCLVGAALSWLLSCIVQRLIVGPSRCRSGGAHRRRRSHADCWYRGQPMARSTRGRGRPDEGAPT